VSVRRRRLAGWLLAALACWGCAPCGAQANRAGPTVTIAAASDLAIMMKEMGPAFEKRTGYKANVSFGSSGNFYAQMVNGAPFDVFLSADVDYPRRLIAAGAADATSLYVYGIGRLVLWMPGKSADFAREGLQALLQPTVHTIAIANPAHAPYGRAAVAALRQAGIYEQVEPKLVLGENISQAAQFVESGNADAGLIPLSLIKGMRTPGMFVELPKDSYPAIEQAAVIRKSAQNRDGADAFLKFLKSDEGRRLLRAYGFAEPQEKP
jgi:molybdate transport system substrate-binding protein